MFSNYTKIIWLTKKKKNQNNYNYYKKNNNNNNNEIFIQMTDYDSKPVLNIQIHPNGSPEDKTAYIMYSWGEPLLLSGVSKIK